MSSAAKRMPRAETTRQRQKTTDGVVKSAKAKPEKRAKSTDKPATRSRKASVKKSPSRSPSRSRATTRKTSTIGAKVFTKKELEAEKKESKTSRAGSVKRASSRSKSVERRAKRAHTPTKQRTYRDEVERLQMQYGTDNVRNSYFEDDDDILASGPGRYSLRKRVSPSTQIGSASPARSATSYSSASSISITKRDQKKKSSSCSLCGYLCYKSSDKCKIIMATLVLLIGLAIINYFHLVDLSSIQASISNITSSSCECIKTTVKSFKTFFTNLWSRIAGGASQTSSS